MKDLITVRIYFEYGQKIDQQSFWAKLYASDFSRELLKRAKAFGLHQVLHLIVNKGYLNNQKINWGTNEIRHYKHPHLIEITDSESRINQFLDQEKHILQQTKVLFVKNEALLKLW
jgi:PII-like signaling protein